MMRNYYHIYNIRGSKSICTYLRFLWKGSKGVTFAVFKFLQPYSSILMNFLNNWVHYPLWVLEMLIGYSTYLINIYLGISVFQLDIFVNVKTLLTN